MLVDYLTFIKYETLLNYMHLTIMVHILLGIGTPIIGLVIIIIRALPVTRLAQPLVVCKDIYQMCVPSKIP